MTQGILSQLESIGYTNFKPIQGRKVQVLTDEHRVSAMERIARLLGGVINPDPRKGSSLGCVEVGGFNVLVKPASRQGSNSAGISNETFALEAIQAALEAGAKNVRFKTAEREVLLKNVQAVELTGRDTSARKKSDMVFHMTDGSVFKVSLKKDNAECWESADTFARDIVRGVLTKALEEQLVSLEKLPGNIFKISKNLAWRATKEQALDLVFGSDLRHNGAVVVKTFSRSSFSLQGDTLEIEVSGILSELSDLDEDQHVYFLVRNDRSRLSGVAGYPGLRVLAVTKSRITKNVVLL